MDKKEQFKHYMLAGHGRAAKMLDGNEEYFRDIVLYGCLNDISYDLQCEGSRGWYVYNLVNLYENTDYFLNQATEKFLSDEVFDWHTVNHLCDFIVCFAEDGNQAAKNAIEEKYARLYTELLSSKKGIKARHILQSYEYLAMTIIECGDFERTLRIFSDMGGYFLKRRRTKDEDLKWRFSWFWSRVKDEYGEEFVRNQLEETGESSKELARFKRVMFTEESEIERTPKPQKPEPTVDQVIELAEREERIDYAVFRIAEESEKIRLANAILAESNLKKKARMLFPFTYPVNVFPFASELVEYARSDNEALQSAALNALVYVNADSAHDFALELLSGQYLDHALKMLLKNYRDGDKAFLLDWLEKLPIDQENASGWHDVVGAILDVESGILPDEVYLFVYEKSRCSYCREGAFDEMKRRNLLKEEILSECLWDSNSDIQKMAQEIQDQS